MSEAEPISVVILAKNCREALKTCLDSVREFVLPVDEILVCDTGSSDGTDAEAVERGARVIRYADPAASTMLELAIEYSGGGQLEEALRQDPQLSDGFLSDFAAARQFATDEARHDLIFWIDADDIIYQPRELRRVAAQHFSRPDAGPLFLDYAYWFDSTDGACVTRHWRERIFDRRRYHWAGACHESAIPIDKQSRISITRVPPEVSRIEHRGHKRDGSLSDLRNYTILRYHHTTATKNNGWRDPRWLFYLGNACRGLKRFDEARKWYGQLIRCSGSRDDRFAAAINIATIFQIKGRPWRAMDWYFQAMKIHPSEPRAYFGVARCWFDLKRLQEALHWTGLGFQCPVPDTLAAVDPNSYDFYPRITALLALVELKRYSEALSLIAELRRLRPGYELLDAYEEEVRRYAAGAQFESAVATLLSQAASPEAAERILGELKPEVRARFPSLQRESANSEPADITYLCPPTVEPWDGARNDIGGSEKMVVQLTREWARAGHTVAVYGKPRAEQAYKTIDGVQWLPWEAFNPRVPRRTVVVWRNHGLLDMPLRADKLLVDLHDIQDPSYFYRPRLDKVRAYIFKSKFHAQTAGIEGPAIRVLRNGIDLSLFDGPAPERDLKRIAFCSSADRGLLTVLRIWQRICGGLRGATLHIYYGFTPLYTFFAAQREYQHFGDDDCDRHMWDYAEECLTLMDRLPRVINHERVSWPELAHDLRQTGIWLYPTRFGEISCLSAMEAQIAGAWPIYYPTGALPETVIAGEACNSIDEAAAAIRRTIARGHDLDTAREELAAAARERFDIRPLASQILEL